MNQFKESATLGQWSDEERASLLFLSLTGGAWMYFLEHHAPGACRPEERKESVGQGTCRQHETLGQSGLLLQRLPQPREDSAPRVPGSCWGGIVIENCRARLQDTGDGRGDTGDPRAIYPELGEIKDD